MVGARAGVVAILILGLVVAATPQKTGAVAVGQIQFVRNGHTYFMNADGSGQHAARLVGAPDWPPDWSRDGRRMVFATGRFTSQKTRLFVANRDGSDRHPIMSTFPNQCVGADWSPDGKRIVYDLGCEVDFTSMFVVRRDGSGRRRLARRFWTLAPKWSPDGRTILFTGFPPSGLRDWALYLADPAGRTPHRIPGPSLDSALLGTGTWSRDGKRIFLLNALPGSRRAGLFVLDRTGSHRQQLTRDPLKIYDFALSPDGRNVAMEAAVGNRDWDIYVINADGTALRQLTDNNAYDRQPQWSPDGRRIAFMSDRDGRPQVYIMNADGTGQMNISRSRTGDESPSWVPAQR